MGAISPLNRSQKTRIMNKVALLLFSAVALVVGALLALRAEATSATSPMVPGLERALPGSSEVFDSPLDFGPAPLDSPLDLDRREDANPRVIGADATSASSGTTSVEVAARRERGKLIGRVIDENGTPVPGAILWTRGRGLGGVMHESRLERPMPGELESGCAEDGRFSIDVSAGAVLVMIEADGFAPHELTTAVERDKEVDLGDVRLSVGVTLSGRVVDRDGNGIAGATLCRSPSSIGGMLAGQRQHVAATSGEGGAFLIRCQASGRYELHVSHSEFSPGRLQGEASQPGATISGLEVVLEDGASLRGTVMGKVLGDDSLSVMADLGDMGPHALAFPGTVRSLRESKVDSDGSFELRGLMPSTEFFLCLVERTSTGAIRRSQSVLVATPAKGLGPAVVLNYTTGAAVSFTPTDTAGAPLIPDSVKAGFGFAFHRPNVRMDSSTGRCTLDGLWPKTGGEALQLRVIRHGYEDWTGPPLSVSPGQAIDLGRIALVERPMVRIAVLDDSTGDPVEGARVSVYLAPRSDAKDPQAAESYSFVLGGEEAVSSGKTDRGGLVLLNSVVGQQLEFRVEDELHEPYRAEAILHPVDQRIFEHEIRLRAGASLRVVALDPSGQPAEGYSVELAREAHEIMAARRDRTGGDGVLLICGLAPGVHRVRLGHRGGGGGTLLAGALSDGASFGSSSSFGGFPKGSGGRAWTEVMVQAGSVTEVGLTAPANGALSGSVTESARPLAGASVRLRSRSGGGAGLGELLALEGQGAMSAYSDSVGDFSIAGVEAGEYELVIEHPTRAMAYTHAMVIEGGEQHVVLDLPVTEISGVVLGEKGQPLAGARLRAMPASEATVDSPMASRMIVMTGDGGGESVSLGGDLTEPAYSTAEGRFTLRGVTANESVVVTAATEGYVTAVSRPFTLGEGAIEADVTIRCQPSGSIRIELDGWSGNALALLRRASAKPFDPADVRMLHGATTLLGAVEPGAWTVSLQSIGGEPLHAEPSLASVKVVGGATAVVSVKLP